MVELFLFAFIGVLILVTAMLALIGVFINWGTGDYLVSTLFMTVIASISISLIIMYLFTNGGM